MKKRVNDFKPVPGSFRDPKGHVFYNKERILRLVTQKGKQDYEFVRDSGTFECLIKKDLLIEYEQFFPDEVGIKSVPNAAYYLEHPKLKFISYPYEWSFSMLKMAALAQLDIYLIALENGVMLSDASAYNIQFLGAKPKFIDYLSFRPYSEGEYWFAHRQFCEQFLNPLLLYSVCGVPFNAWYRGNLEGIGTNELNKIIPILKKIQPGIFLHVTLQSFFQRNNKSLKNERLTSSSFPLKSFKNMLGQLRNYIETLDLNKNTKSNWADYVEKNTYETEESNAKHTFIREYVKTEMPELIWDLGCNTGEYSIAALKYGVKNVIGFDSDHYSLNSAYNRAIKNNLNYLPLYMDMANPSPSQGWEELERDGLIARKSSNGIFALALVHHLAIGRNIPLQRVLHWIVSLSPSGVIEYIPKSDPMVKKMLSFKGDIFPEYSYECFKKYMNNIAEIVQEKKITKEGRALVWYKIKQKDTYQV